MDLSPFARTNVQTIEQRAELLVELLPLTHTIAEICCGDCTQQARIYRQRLDLVTYCGLEILAERAAANRAKGVECFCGDALDPAVMERFLAFDVIFFGPPLSLRSDGHHHLGFKDIRPSYAEFTHLLLQQLAYRGALVCIGPRSTTLGDVQSLYQRIRNVRPEFGLRLLHYSYSTVTGFGETTLPRLKYVELWFSSVLEDRWEIRKSGGSQVGREQPPVAP